jgi:hypothetical protein
MLRRVELASIITTWLIKPVMVMMFITVRSRQDPWQTVRVRMLLILIILLRFILLARVGLVGLRRRVFLLLLWWWWCLRDGGKDRSG